MRSLFLTFLVFFSVFGLNARAASFADIFASNTVSFSDLSAELAMNLNILSKYDVVYIQSGRVLAGDGLIEDSLPSCALAKRGEGYVNPGDNFVVTAVKDKEGFSEIRVDFSLEKIIGVSCWPAEGPFEYTSLEDVRSAFGGLFTIELR